MVFCLCEKPSLNGFIEFIRGEEIPESAIKDDNPMLKKIYCRALSLTPRNSGLENDLCLFTECVYCLATSFLFNYAIDEPPSTFFEDKRNQLGLNKLSVGLLSSASDQGTSANRVISNAFGNLSLLGLNLIKDPYGQRFLEIMMEFGTYAGLS